MKSKPYVLGVVIARQGSKGVPGKNMARVGGDTLLGYAIRAARKAHTLDAVLFSTDSKEMAAFGKKCGAQVPFLRPKYLAQDKTHTPPVIEHAVRFWERTIDKPVDIVVTLQATSPFRRAEHIDAAVTLLLKNLTMDSVISVKHAAFPPFWLFIQKGKLLVPFVKSGVDYSLKERQQLPTVFQPNGAVFVSRRHLLKKGIIYSGFSGGKMGFVYMDNLSSIDIDHPQDLVLARTVLKTHPTLAQK